MLADLQYRFAVIYEIRSRHRSLCLYLHDLTEVKLKGSVCSFIKNDVKNWRARLGQVIQGLIWSLPHI